ncbi:hypothetical protein HDU77_002009 [Chytriomyces hyalinus]|nr:hypothetical protein HDU77_002009 [Chytriomyces hyalinus]
MKLVAVLAASLAGLGLVAAECANPRVRQEWHQMSDADKSAFVKATHALTLRPVSNQYADPSVMAWHDFVIGHSNNAFWAHGNAQFYPYHRAMLWQFENALISTGLWPSNKGIPYFDWSAMSQNWWTSDIFSGAYFGSAVSTDPDTCVVNGAFSKNAYSVAPDEHGRRNKYASSGDAKCLRRNGQVGSALNDATSLAEHLSSPSYVSFTCQTPVSGEAYYDETNFHSTGHGVLGGPNSDLGDASVSPNDPLFYMHHAFVDKYYWRWQSQCDAFLYDYTGVLANSDDPVSSGTNIASAFFNLDTWPFTVAQVLNTQGNTLCYTYSKSSGDIAPAKRPVCPTPKKFDIPAASAATLSISDPAADSWMVSSLVNLIRVKPASVAKGIVAARDGNATAVVAVEEIATEAATTEAHETQAAAHGTFGTKHAVEKNETQSILDQNAYTATEHTNGSTIISYTKMNYTITIPENFEKQLVFTGAVVALNEKGEKERFFPPTKEVSYMLTAAGFSSLDVAAGTSCLIAPPPKLSKEYFASMHHSYERYISAYNTMVMKLDVYNEDMIASKCANAVSPSTGRS